MTQRMIETIQWINYYKEPETNRPLYMLLNTNTNSGGYSKLIKNKHDKESVQKKDK
ncbi:4584_t:CDS:2 [Funneliformis geosporum]|uniref:4584_t:CDS:1 n=1 Tax=Funneliformis geosporum TaxID=1117311 RepID=A0A9W4SEI9_9GLOM|nr:4584_t:CDS:2 [Funneliformis geosporum]